MTPTTETTSPRKTVGRAIPARVADCLFVGVAALLPVMLCVYRLGIYADDWGLFAFFRAQGGRTTSDYFRLFYSLPVTHSRPVMDLYEAVLFRLFGTHPLGYHVVNSLVFVTSACLFYLSLSLIMRERLLAVSIPLLFVVLPNYSSARFVPFAFMVGLSMAFFFLNLYALLKAAQGTKLWPVWTGITVAALVISGLAYEVALPVFAFSMLVVWYLERKKPVAARTRPRTVALIFAS